MGQKPGDLEELLKQSQKELLWLQRQLSFISTGGPVCVLAASKVSSFIIFSVYLTLEGKGLSSFWFVSLKQHTARFIFHTKGTKRKIHLLGCILNSCFM